MKVMESEGTAAEKIAGPGARYAGGAYPGISECRDLLKEATVLHLKILALRLTCFKFLLKFCNRALQDGNALLQERDVVAKDGRGSVLLYQLLYGLVWVHLLIWLIWRSAFTKSTPVALDGQG